MPETDRTAHIALELLEGAARARADADTVATHAALAVAVVGGLQEPTRGIFHARLATLAQQYGVRLPDMAAGAGAILLGVLRTPTACATVQQVLLDIQPRIELRPMHGAVQSFGVWSTPASDAHPFASATALFHEVDGALRWAFDSGEIESFILVP